jgi:uncharacterized protein with ParB-like and HNH nuclease domain
MRIDQILDKIDENQLFVPAFQREYVWKRNDAKILIASLLESTQLARFLRGRQIHPLN